MNSNIYLQLMAITIRLRKCLLFAFLIGFTIHCSAQSRQFQHLTSNEGISQSEVYSFLEDSHGFIWFGTVDGLNRYDGYQVTTFHTDKNNLNSITNNTIRCLAEDELGRIWIGTDDGLSVYDEELEEIHQIHLKSYTDTRLSINAALVDNGKLYIGTSKGLLMLDVEPTDLIEIEESVYNINIPNDRADRDVVACKQSLSGDVWVTTSKNVYQLSYAQENRAPELDLILELEDILPDLRDIEEDGFGNLWVVSHDNGFMRYHPRTEKLKHFTTESVNNDQISNKISCVTIDQLGHLWIGTHDKGLLYLDKDLLNTESPKFQRIKHDPHNDRSLNSNLIYSLYVSKDNLLWIGTIGSGINIYDPNRKPFQYYNLENATLQSLQGTNFVRAVYADLDDNIWIGTHNNGLFILNRGQQDKITKVGFGSEPVFHINDAGKGNSLVCAGSGIHLVKRTNRSLQIVSTKLIGPSFYTTAVEDGIFWVATLYGLKKCRVSNNEIIIEQEITTNTNPSVSLDNCRVLYFSKDTGELFIGTEGGGLTVVHLDDNQNPIHSNVYTKADAADSLSNNYIRSIIKSSSADIWIGTYEGLNKMNINPNTGKASFKSYTKNEGLPNNTIQSIVEDQQKNLWIGTNQGLCKFNPETEVFTLFSVNDGIQSNEFSEHAIFKKSDNEIIIGGINGINLFYPQQIASHENTPNTTLTDFYLFNKRIRAKQKTADSDHTPLRKSISLSDSIMLKPSQNSFGFEFSAMVFNSPEKIRYAYMLDGFDIDWNVTDANNRKANYTNLAYGDYVFKVKATNNDGEWEKTPKHIFVSIQTPFYYTPLALVLYALLAFLAFIFFANYSVLRATTKEKILLDNFHNKRLRELEELRTRFFINVSHDLRTPLTLISSPLDVIQKDSALPPELKGTLNLVQRNVKKLKDMTEQLLDLSKAETGSLVPKLKNVDIVSFVQSEALLFEQAFKNKNIDLLISSDEESYLFSFDPDMISKVVFNMLSNALKHTQEGSVSIHISKVLKSPVKHKVSYPYESFIKIKIEDSGLGIAETDVALIFDRFYQGKDQSKKGYGIGLSHCKDLIEAHNGCVDVTSSIGKGSVFNVYLPYATLPIGSTETSIPNIKNGVTESTSEMIVDPVTPGLSLESHSKTILLVEDNEDLRQFLSKELSRQYTVLEAMDGLQGLELAKTHFPDLIVSDVMMPKMDGMEFCKEIKTELKTSHIPVILLTAKVDKESKYKGLEIGADDYISKPFEIDYLFLRIKNLLGNRERLQKMFQTSLHFEPSIIAVNSIDEEFLATLLSKIENGIPDANFSIQNLEQELGMSHSSFYNKIKSLTGQSAKELVFTMRMKRAKQILEDTINIRVSEVAYMVGFTDPKYFSKRFKEHFGDTPSGFTKKS